MISAMRRLGRAFLRAPWARRVAALTVTFGLLGSNGLMVATTAFAAPLGSNPAVTVSGPLTLSQELCQVLPALCQTGPSVVAPPSGVLAPVPAQTSGQATLPSTGCLLGLIGCSPPTPAPTATPKATPAPTVKPSAAATAATTPAPISTPAAATPPAAAGGCLLGILGACSTAAAPAAGGCLLGILGACSTPAGTCTQGASGCQATPTSSGLCLLNLCGVLQIGGNSCVATLLRACVISTVPPAPPSPGSPASSPGVCVGTLLCLLGSSCTASLGSTCLLGAVPVLPGLPSVGSGSPGSQASGGPSASEAGTAPGSGAADPGTTLPAGTTTGTFLSTVPTGSSQRPGGGGGQSGLGTQQPRHDETVGLVSGLTFGHGLIIWPLFGLLDLAALAGLVVVVRRRWTATTN
jgi:hypothetical protein